MKEILPSLLGIFPLLMCVCVCVCFIRGHEVPTKGLAQSSKQRCSFFQGVLVFGSLGASYTVNVVGGVIQRMPSSRENTHVKDDAGSQVGMLLAMFPLTYPSCLHHGADLNDKERKTLIFQCTKISKSK